MKLKEKMNIFLFIILWFTISYLLCSTHELPTTTNGYISRRKRFCSTPFYIFVIISIVVVFMYN